MNQSIATNSTDQEIVREPKYVKITMQTIFNDLFILLINCMFLGFFTIEITFWEKLTFFEYRSILLLAYGFNEIPQIICNLRKLLIDYTFLNASNVLESVYDDKNKIKNKYLYTCKTFWNFCMSIINIMMMVEFIPFTKGCYNYSNTICVFGRIAGCGGIIFMIIYGINVILFGISMLILVCEIIYTLYKNTIINNIIKNSALYILFFKNYDKKCSICKTCIYTTANALETKCCKHTLHNECISKWLCQWLNKNYDFQKNYTNYKKYDFQKNNTNYKSICPFCKHELIIELLEEN